MTEEKQKVMAAFLPLQPSSDWRDNYEWVAISSYGYCYMPEKENEEMTKIPNFRHIQIVQMVRVDIAEGEGTAEDPRTVVSYYFDINDLGKSNPRALFKRDPRDREKTNAD